MKLFWRSVIGQMLVGWMNWWYLCCLSILKGSAHEHEKNASKTSHGKKPVATRVKKIKNQSCSPFAIATRITAIKKHWSMDNTYCLPSCQIPPVFLNFLSITNNNNGLPMSKAFIHTCQVSRIMQDPPRICLPLPHAPTTPENLPGFLV